MNQISKSVSETDPNAIKLFKGIVYMYTNKNDGKVYIGETIDLKKRIRTHEEHKSHMDFHLAIRKETFDVFEFSILFEYESENKQEVKSKLEEMEEFYINEYQSHTKEKGYNFCRGARWGYNQIFWKLTTLEGEINGVFPHPGTFPECENRLEVIEQLKKEREELRIKLGAPY